MGVAFGMEQLVQVPSPMFRVPKLITQIARYGARVFGLKQMPLICQADTTLAPAAMFSQNEVKQVLLTPSTKDINKLLIRGIYGSSRLPQDTILLHPNFFDEFYGGKKSILLHELWHVKQYQEYCNIGKNLGDITLNPAVYPKGCEYEADIETAHATRCCVCIEDFAQLRGFSNSKKYATQAEIHEVAKSMPEHQVCPYHNIIMNKLRKSSRLSHFVDSCVIGSVIGAGSYLGVNSVGCGRNVAGIASAMAGIAAGLNAFTKPLLTNDYTRIKFEKKHGQAVEKCIARGELEP